MRLLFTHKPADPAGCLASPHAALSLSGQQSLSSSSASRAALQVFDALTLFCISVFVLEIVLCMFAKDDECVRGKMRFAGCFAKA